VRAAFGLHALWKEIESLDNRVPAKTQTAMFLMIARMMDSVLPWFLMQNEVPVKLQPTIERYKAGVERVAAWFAKNPSAVCATANKSEQNLIEQGVPKLLAHRLAIMPHLAIAPDLTRLAAMSGCAINEAAAVFFGLGERLHLEDLRERITTISGPETPWQNEAMMVLLNDLLDGQRTLTRNVIGLKAAMKRKTCSMQDLLTAWTAKNSQRLERYDMLIEEIRAIGKLDVAMLTLASHQLNALVR
jgi:glutamate dehydrogenase